MPPEIRSARIRRTDVRPISNRRAISDLLCAGSPLTFEDLAQLPGQKQPEFHNS
jgi:hypothetical protein